MSEPTDAALIERIARRDQRAVGELYDRYQGLMYGLASRITGDRTFAQDVVQEAFLGIWRNASRYSQERASARTWILSITHHRAVDAARKRRPTVELPDSDLPPPAALTAPDVWPEVAQHLEAETVQQALIELPAAQREAIELAYFAGLSQNEIAERTEMPLGTVKSRVRLGLATMRRVLESDARGWTRHDPLVVSEQRAIEDPA